MTMTSIYQLIQNDPDPKHWQEFIDAHENLRADDPDIINQVLHSSTHHIQTILDSENYIALGQYIAYLKHHFLTSYRYQLQLNKTIPELIHEHLLGIHSPEKKADIIELLKDNEALSFQTYSKLIAEQRQAITKIVAESARASLQR